MVRRAVDPGRLDEILAAEQQAGALWPADHFAAAVGDERRAALQVHVRQDGQDLRRGVDEDRDIVLFGHGGNGLDRHRSAVGAGAPFDIDHGRLRTDRELQGIHRVDFDQLGAHRRDCRVVAVPRLRRNDDFVLGEASQVGDADVQVGVAAGDAGGSGMRDGGRTTGADHAPLCAGQLGQPLSGRGHQLVHLDVLLVGERLGGAHFRLLHGPANHRDRAPAVDERPDTERFVDFRPDFHGSRVRQRRCRGGRLDSWGRKEVPRPRRPATLNTSRRLSPRSRSEDQLSKRFSITTSVPLKPGHAASRNVNDTRRVNLPGFLRGVYLLRSQRSAIRSRHQC